LETLDALKEMPSFYQVMDVSPSSSTKKRGRQCAEERQKVGETLLELAGCGMLNLAELDLNGVVNPIPVKYSDISPRSETLASPLFQSPDSSSSSSSSTARPTLPSWVTDAFENKVIELIAIVEFLVDNYKMFSTHEERDKEGLN
jgi:hypothetical protein